ncbi:hypothetical protein CLCR_00999 [Cladophialophora carrionii]|uniref:Uncharacterized protein n=1 Tax=Cladophialophora carrionii TaxID=86049 RepID=A0A1C1D1C3_9EURO|nr:hypothetical protein CLCR_00999 [Cladophialophora carrionii]
MYLWTLFYLGKYHHRCNLVLISGFCPSAQVAVDSPLQTVAAMCGTAPRHDEEQDHQSGNYTNTIFVCNSSQFVSLAETLSKMNSTQQRLSKGALLAYAPSRLISPQLTAINM